MTEERNREKGRTTRAESLTGVYPRFTEHLAYNVSTEEGASTWKAAGSAFVRLRLRAVAFAQAKAQAQVSQPLTLSKRRPPNPLRIEFRTSSAKTSSSSKVVPSSPSLTYLGRAQGKKKGRILTSQNLG